MANSPAALRALTSGYSATDEIKASMMGFPDAKTMFETLNKNVGKPSQFWTDYNKITGKNEPVPINSRVTPSPMAKPVTSTNPMPVPRVASLPAGTGANIPSNLSRLLGTPVTNPARLPGTGTTNTNIPSNINTLLGGTTVAGSTGYNYMNDPSYQFRLQEGLRAILGQNAARGMLNSGRTLRELLRYGSDYASQEFQNEFARKYSLANLGMQSAATQLGGANVPIPGIAGIGNLQVPQAQQTNLNLGALSPYGSLMQGGAGNVAQAGQFLGAGQAGATQAWGNVFGGLANLFGQNNPFSSTSSSPSLTSSFSPNMFSSPQTSGNFSGLRLY